MHWPSRPQPQFSAILLRAGEQFNVSASVRVRVRVRVRVLLLATYSFYGFCFRSIPLSPNCRHLLVFIGNQLLSHKCASFINQGWLASGH